MLLHNGKDRYDRLNIALSNLFPGAVKGSARINIIYKAGIDVDLSSNVLLSNRLQIFLCDPGEEIWEEMRIFIS